MAQLRDSVTSELLGEGTPTEMVMLADQLGRDDVIFDGVASEHDPDAFDPDAVLLAHEERVDGLQTALRVETDPEAKAQLAQALADAAAPVETAKELAEDARAVMEDARARVDA